MAKSVKKKGTGAANELLAALKFVQLAQHTDGETYEQHCKLSKNMATAFDGVMSCGHPITDGLDAQPHTATLVKAIAKCKDALSLTHVDDQILVASAGFRVRVPCDPVPLSVAVADPPAVAVGETLTTALAAVVGLPEDGEPQVTARSVLVRGSSVVGCRRGHVLVEAWHGLGLACDLAVPALSVKAALAAGKPIVALGWSERSVTFHYGDGSWIKTQLADGTWFEYERILNVHGTFSPLPATFIDGIAHLKDFTGDGRVRFGTALLHTSDDDKIGASFECEGISGPGTFKIEYLEIFKMFSDIVVDFHYVNGCLFHGKTKDVDVRGVIMRMKT